MDALSIDRLRAPDRFEEFGHDPYLPTHSAALQWITPQSSLRCSERIDFYKSAVRSLVPKVPGVYGMIDATGRLIYVGKSKALRNRLISYFLPNNEEEKSGRIAQSAYSIVWETQPSEFAALLREQCLIRRWQPRMNVVGMPKRQQQAYLCLGHGPADTFYLSRYHDTTAKCSQGPLSGMGNLHRAVEILARHFLLRDCPQKTPMHMSDQLALFDLEFRAGCVRHEIGNCLAPCLSSCGKAQYREQVNHALHFLREGDDAVEAHLVQAMEKAAAGLHFEHAARLKEDARILRWLSRRLLQFNQAREAQPMVYCVPHWNGTPIWYLLKHGGIERVIHQPNSATEWRKTKVALGKWSNEGRKIGSGNMDPEETIGLVTAWLQKEKKEATKGQQPSQIVSENRSQMAPPSRAWTAPVSHFPASWSDFKEFLDRQYEWPEPKRRKPSSKMPQQLICNSIEDM